VANQKTSDQVLTASNTAATAVDSSQVSLTDLSAATVGAVGSQMTFAAASALPAATSAYYPYTYLSPGSKTSSFPYGALGDSKDVGTFHKGTSIALVDWQGENSSPSGRYHVGYDDAFGIAPDRTIWHSAYGTNGWQEMMNGSQPAFADQMSSAAIQDGGKHTVVVEVTTGVSSPQLWYSEQNSNGNWGIWVKAT
jgi:hypothetical protein